jgi:hypothetical protein
MGSKKVPGMVVLHCDGRRYGNAYLIAVKLGPLGAHARTQTHTQACSIDPANVVSTGGKFILESSGLLPSHLICCPPWLRNIFP